MKCNIILLFQLILSSTLPIHSSCFPSQNNHQLDIETQNINHDDEGNAYAPPPPPIVYTIAGSDSGGGAGIQADLRAIHAMSCHGCSAVTCLTAQNSMGVSKNGIHAPPSSFLREQLSVLLDDLYPRAVKVGMLGTEELAIEVGRFLKDLKDPETCTEEGEEPFVVIDPVMVATSGSKLITDDAMNAMIKYVFPYADVLTPNKHEAEELLGRKFKTPQDVEQGAKEILQMGVKSVLIKGGHFMEENMEESHNSSDINNYAQDYFLSANDESDGDRLCDGVLGVWLRSIRYDTIHTHGTGCTLSSAIASALAIGHQQRELSRNNGAGHGANSAINTVDACVLGKAYVTAGIAKAVQLGEGPGPVAQTEFPSSSDYFPTLVQSATSMINTNPFLSMNSYKSITNDTNKPTLGKILPIVDTVDWVKQLSRIQGITDIQLRIKGESNEDEIQNIVNQAQTACAAASVRLWINDYWEAAINAKCFGVHLGQEDLKRCADKGGLEQIKASNLALGISTHSYAELAVALAMRPSYISLGPVFGTKSKRVAFEPQGLKTVKKWRNLIHGDIPLVAIGGIENASMASKVEKAGADSIAVIGAIIRAENAELATQNLLQIMS